MTPNTPPNMTTSDWNKVLQEFWDPHHIIPSSHQAKWKTAIVFMAHPAFPGMHLKKKHNSNTLPTSTNASIGIFVESKKALRIINIINPMSTSPLHLFLLVEPTSPTSRLPTCSLWRRHKFSTRVMRNSERPICSSKSFDCVSFVSRSVGGWQLETRKPTMIYDIVHTYVYI